METQDLFAYKPYLFTIAYNMLGDISASEDLVQDTFEKWLSLDKTGVQSPKAYLSKIIFNKAIDLSNTLKKERAAYKGLWMPEPILADNLEKQNEDTLEYAVLFLLEKLNPLERAVFILKEVFSYSHEKIAELLDISTDNSRQLLHRAKANVRSPKKKKEAELGEHKKLIDAFLLATYQKDFDKLKEIFLEDIVLYTDAGGKVSAALNPIYGITNVLKFFQGVSKHQDGQVFEVKYIKVNSSDGVLIFKNGIIDTVLEISTSGGVISEVFFIRNPDKIKLPS